MYVHVYVYVYVHIYIYIYIHTLYIYISVMHYISQERPQRSIEETFASGSWVAPIV